MPADELIRVKRAASRLRVSRSEWRAALVAARESGASYSEIGRAAGVSRQGIRKLLSERSE